MAMSSLLMLLFLMSYTACSESDDHITITQISQDREHTHLSIKILTAIQNDFYKLSDPQIISTPVDNPNHLGFVILPDGDAENECIHEDQQQSRCCYQSFIISSTNTNEQCPLYLKGSFVIKFDIDCNEATNILLSSCTDFIESNGATTTLQVGITYTDSICNQQIFTVGDEWSHFMTFFKDEDYTQQLGENECYEPYDILYAELEIHHPSSYDMTQIHLQNVWLCSAPPTEDIFSFDGEGCFDEDVDQNGPFWIVQNGESAMFNALITSEVNDPLAASTTIKYQFIVPSMNRDTLYIHNQLAIEIGQENERITLIWAVFEHVDIRNVFMPFYEFKRNMMYLNSGKKWMVLLGIFTGVLLFMMMLLMVSMKMFRVNERVECETDINDEDELLRKPMVKKIGINNRDFMQYGNDDDDDDTSEYVDREYDNDPLDQSY